LQAAHAAQPPVPDLVFPGAAYSRNPKARALADPLKQQVKERGLWALFLDRELGGPGFGQLKLALLNEVLGRYRSAPAVAAFVLIRRDA
jgi:acyl-CoA dehydrogenase